MKLALLKTICETPGWQPPAGGVPPDAAIALNELTGEGLIVERSGGYEATPEALDLLPNLEEGEDGKLVRVEREPEPSKKPLHTPPLDWNVPQRARVFLVESMSRTGWAVIGGAWLFFYDEQKDRWITWSSDRVVRVEWVTHV